MTVHATTADLTSTAPATQPGKAAAYKLASILLQYPTQALFDGIEALEAAARSGAGPARGHFMRFLDWLRATPPHEVAQHYVATFDLRRRSALYLTYYRHGDTRRRGMALLAFKNAYRVAGLELAGDDLPDHLPVVLDFAAVAPAGEDLLRRHRTELELLRRTLRDDGTPYVHVIEALCAQLPRLRRADILRIRAAEQKGPPAEDVGIEPFAPPGYLTGQEVSR
ncbi:MAG: nitrate reductase molybdenum cofactor assembly chaperone [Nocardiopsaceae bacterium]|jgi:nitrate reductase delta subunit|nr:nitrate reductase molybdenum cofactor assembly chaperone [Nocardiopsaceae bacterium]